MKHGMALVAALALLSACKGGASQSELEKSVPAPDAVQPAPKDAAQPATPRPTLQLEADKRLATSPETGLVVQLGPEWEMAEEQPAEGVGFRATHKVTLAACSVMLAPLKGRTMKELLDTAQLKKDGGPIETIEFDAKLGDLPAKAKQLTNTKKGTHYTGTLEFRFAEQGDNFAAAYCVHTPLPKNFKPEGEAEGEAAAKAKAEPKAEQDPNAGAKAVFDFFEAVKLPAKAPGAPAMEPNAPAK